MAKPKNLSKIEEEDDDVITTATSSTDICKTLMERYSKSAAPQHHHLCASAAAMKSILIEEHLPLTPLTYFAATISAINDLVISSDLSSISPLCSLLSILLPVLPEGSLPKDRAIGAVDVMVGLVKKQGDGVSTATMRCVVKCLGSLVLLCDLEDWEKVRVAVEMIWGFSIDKRPKVRRCAQVYVEKMFSQFPSSVNKEASKVVYALFKSYLPHAAQMNDEKLSDESKQEMLSKPEHLEVVHMLNSLKLIVPYLSKKVSQKMLSDLYKLLSGHFSPLTRHLFNVLEVFLKSVGTEAIFPDVESAILSLTSYVSVGDKNPMDTVVSASSLLKSVMVKLHDGEPSICTQKLPLVFRAIAGVLAFEAYSSQGADIIREMINKHLDGNTFKVSAEDSSAIASTCIVFEDILSGSKGIPNEHVLAVVSELFYKLGEVSYICIKGIILKLADLIKLEKEEVSETKHLQVCIGSAIRAIGPEKMLTLIPVCHDTEKNICSNIWLIPILNKYVIGASIKYFLENIVPLIESLQQARQKVKKSSRRRDLQTYINGLWELLPAFCRYPTDTDTCFEHLAKVLTNFLKEDYTHENIALALQELVNQNRIILLSMDSVTGSVENLDTHSKNDSDGEARSIPSHYSIEVATRNVQALESCSMDLLHALTDVFFSSHAENRNHIKVAIGCLASITESSKIHQLFNSSLEKYGIINVDGESNKLENNVCPPVEKDLSDDVEIEEQEAAKRCMMMEFAHSLVAGAKEDLLSTIFEYIKPTLQVAGGAGQSEAYCTLSKIIEEHSSFCSSRINEMVDLLVGTKSTVDIMILRNQFACFQNLLVYLLKSDLEDSNAKAFLILNEIIVALKDSNEEPRKVAYDVLLRISDTLSDQSSTNSNLPLQQLLNMIIGYLSGAPPPIMSSAVSALSLLIYKNPEFCFSVPELVPSVIGLLESKAKEVIKAVLGFVKVMVSCIQASDLQELLPDIVNGIIPWSSVSKNHFRAKVATIFEIIIRKCGYSSVEPYVPDRYKGFIKNVKEQRHKASSKDGGEASDKVPNQSFSSQTRDNKRKFGGTKEDEFRGSKSTQTDREKKKGKFSRPNTNGPNKFSGNDRGKWVSKDKNLDSGGSRKRTERNDQRNKRPFSGGKDNFRQRKENSKTPYRKSGSNSKFRKR
ncbi:hypothetical protein ACHQM5_012691 [Ranunculus cassubicifolius]